MTGRWLREVGYVRACDGKRAGRARSCVRSKYGGRDLGGHEGVVGRLTGRRALRREGEVGTRD